MKRVLVSIDFSDASDKVIKAVAELITSHEQEIFLMHVVEPSIAYEVTGILPNEIPYPMLDHQERLAVKSMTLQTLQDYSAKLARLTPAHIFEVVSDEFEISGAITSWAQENAMDLIVLGKHGRGFLANVLIGSVATSVVKHSTVPVLVVPIVAEEV